MSKIAKLKVRVNFKFVSFNNSLVKGAYVDLSQNR
jgi:hypothetical protein